MKILYRDIVINFDHVLSFSVIGSFIEFIYANDSKMIEFASDYSASFAEREIIEAIERDDKLITLKYKYDKFDSAKKGLAELKNLVKVWHNPCDVMPSEYTPVLGLFFSEEDGDEQSILCECFFSDGEWNVGIINKNGVHELITTIEPEAFCFLNDQDVLK